jgi:hypothetical protein
MTAVSCSPGMLFTKSTRQNCFCCVANLTHLPSMHLQSLVYAQKSSLAVGTSEAVLRNLPCARSETHTLSLSHVRGRSQSHGCWPAVLVCVAPAVLCRAVSTFCLCRTSMRLRQMMATPTLMSATHRCVSHAGLECKLSAFSFFWLACLRACVRACVRAGLLVHFNLSWSPQCC